MTNQPHQSGWTNPHNSQQPNYQPPGWMPPSPTGPQPAMTSQGQGGAPNSPFFAGAQPGAQPAPAPGWGYTPPATSPGPIKPWYRKWWVIAVGVVVVLAVLSSLFDNDSSTSTQTPTVSAVEITTATTQAPVPSTNGAPATTEPAPVTTEPAETQPAVPAEYAAALISAQTYIDLSSFSEAGLYRQLTSEYGEAFPAEAAQFALAHVIVDYNEEALESAMNYREWMAMSNSAIYDQLISEYGEQFTPEQAQYAIDHLPA